MLVGKRRILRRTTLKFQVTTCKDCPDRTIGCHGSCERYEAQRKEFDELKFKMREVHPADAVISDSMTRTLSMKKKLRAR